MRALPLQRIGASIRQVLEPIPQVICFIAAGWSGKATESSVGSLWQRILSETTDTPGYSTALRWFSS